MPIYIYYFTLRKRKICVFGDAHFMTHLQIFQLDFEELSSRCSYPNAEYVGAFPFLQKPKILLRQDNKNSKRHMSYTLACFVECWLLLSLSFEYAVLVKLTC